MRALVPPERVASVTECKPTSCLRCGHALSGGDVEPLRHAVIWRRISGGTNSEAGSRFVERMLSVIATCRQRGRDVLSYLTECHSAHLTGQQPASLLTACASWEGAVAWTPTRRGTSGCSQDCSGKLMG